MIDRICVVLEGLSIAVCLHRLYGKKFRFDIATVSLVTIEMIMMQAIDYFRWPKELSMLFYPIIAVYCVIEFGFNLKELIINNVLNAIIICLLQIIVMVIFYVVDWQDTIVGVRLILSNIIVLMIVSFVFPKIKIKQLTAFLKDRGKVVNISYLVCIFIVISFLVDFKKINTFTHIGFIQYILLFICIVLIGFTTIQLLQYKIKSKEVETELKLHKLYADSFDNLIDNMRLKQHEFDNHINTIYSQHYIYNTYEKLVEAQQSYCQLVTAENKFNKLISFGNRIIIGFLYGKFIEIEKLGVNISYHISIKEMQKGIPIYKIIEILGNLIGNAVEALASTKTYNKLYVFMLEEEKDFIIEIRNESEYIKYSEIELFFTKGYSKKGENRGLGLYHVKAICDEYKLNLSCQNEEIDEINWLSFIVSNKKETI